jgi:hypothetical protein
MSNAECSTLMASLRLDSGPARLESELTAWSPTETRRSPEDYAFCVILFTTL